MLVRAPLVEAEKAGSIRIEDLTKVVMARRRLGLAEERLVPFEGTRDVAYANDRHRLLDRSRGAAHPSMKRFRRSSTPSHCAEINSRCRLASASRFGSICQRLSRPPCVRCTRPASSMTRRCLVIACRVISKRSVSRVIDVGPASHSRETRPSRVASPRAKNTAADSAICAFAPGLRRAGKVLLDEHHLLLPPPLVRRKRLRAPVERDLIEARF